tara:strand:+ start:152 stop:379 length:228 start_codon:yes stop_codon:yes gene_type:complete
VKEKITFPHEYIVKLAAVGHLKNGRCWPPKKRPLLATKKLTLLATYLNEKRREKRREKRNEKRHEKRNEIRSGKK